MENHSGDSFLVHYGRKTEGGTKGVMMKGGKLRISAMSEKGNWRTSQQPFTIVNQELQKGALNIIWGQMGPSEQNDKSSPKNQHWSSFSDNNKAIFMSDFQKVSTWGMPREKL